MAEAVRTLAADRDQALSRIAALERDLDDATGAIKHDRSPCSAIAAALAAAAEPISCSHAQDRRAHDGRAHDNRCHDTAPMTEAAVTPAPPPASQQSVASDPTPMAAPVPTIMRRPRPKWCQWSAPAATGPGLGVDIGGAGNYEGLRTLWRSTKNNDPALLEELYPVVAVRENGKTHGAELRLVIGPLDDAESAARLCATLAAAHHYCQPVAFEGQRFSMNDVGPTKAPPAGQPRRRRTIRAQAPRRRKPPPYRCSTSRNKPARA